MPRKDWWGVKHDDDSTFQECFRKYDQSIAIIQGSCCSLPEEAGMLSFCSFFPKVIYKAWARGLRAAGYATDPKYPGQTNFITLSVIIWINMTIRFRYQLFRAEAACGGIKTGIQNYSQ
jgi:hypothetical protein